MTDLHTPTRRLLLTGLGAIIAAPAIVRASSLMPVRQWREPDMLTLIDWARRRDWEERERMMLLMQWVNKSMADLTWADSALPVGTRTVQWRSA